MTTDHTPNLAVRASKFASLAAVLAVVVGAMVLAGGAFDIAALKSILPGWVSMKANTAACFILIGIALLLASRTVCKAGIQALISMHPPNQDLISHEVQQVVVHRFAPLSHKWERGLLNFVANQESRCGYPAKSSLGIPVVLGNRFKRISIDNRLAAQRIGFNRIAAG